MGLIVWRQNSALVRQVIMAPHLLRVMVRVIGMLRSPRVLQVVNARCLRRKVKMRRSLQNRSH